MYEQRSHSVLNRILETLSPDLTRHDLRYFLIRLGANFYAIHTLFERLYGHRADFDQQLHHLVERMAWSYVARPNHLRINDRAREDDYNWFLSQDLIGMALYTNGFASDLRDLQKKLDYFDELGVNLVHLMPILRCPLGASDGGYAVSDYREIDPRIGDLDDLNGLVSEMRKRNILLVLDVVVNHTSNEHEWAQRAQAGEKKYQDYYYMFDDRRVPDMFEQNLPEVFPENAPGNFTWDKTCKKWVMTVFNNYQWDLNFSNPAVFIEMLDIVLFWANQGADIVRLDAVAFLWKKIGTTSQNENEAHLILQLMKDCCQVVAPGLLFIAEAIVAPSELVKYFGEDAVVAKECEIAYNATTMALLWDAMATKNAKLLRQGLLSLPTKLEGATWLNYVRCHDDIGFGFDDHDIAITGYNPAEHRRFLLDYFIGNHPDSDARGIPFAENPKTGDARISGSLASLIGLEEAIEHADPQLIQSAVDRILLLHGIILSFGGIPLLYYGDELGVTNDFSYLQNLDKQTDNRWVHRPMINWQKAELRHTKGTIENMIFSGIAHLIRIRKSLPVLADFNNRTLLNLSNSALFGFSRFDVNNGDECVVVLANFSASQQVLAVDELNEHIDTNREQIFNAINSEKPVRFRDQLVLQPYELLYLTRHKNGQA